MSKKEKYEKRTEELLESIIGEYEFELVDVEYVKEGQIWYLRAYIDKAGGITVDDCEIVSKRMSVILDQEDYIEDSYIFEVSSPGLSRPLKKEKDFIRNMGKELEIRTYHAVHNEALNNRQGKLSKKEFYGILIAYDTDTVTIQTEEGIEIKFLKSEIALIRLAFHF